MQARFPVEQVTIKGPSTTWKRLGNSGQTVTFHFCPQCGSTVYWKFAGAPDVIGVAIGCFIDPGFPPPKISAFEAYGHPWTMRVSDLPLIHHQG